MRIDAHQHFWRVDRGDYDWLDGHPAIARDFLPADLEPLLAATQIGKTILVQAAPTESETQFLLDLARETPFVAGVVGWVDFAADDAPARIARLCADRKLVALRPMLQDIAEDEWLLRPEHAGVFDAMARGNLAFDALVKPRHLPALAEFLDRHPDLPVVIDHAAKPELARIELWAEYMRHLAGETTVLCKLSGLATEIGPEWSAEVLAPLVDFLFRLFGPERLMWGSDWPVLNEVGDYVGWHAAATSLIPAEAHDAVFGGTAAKFYGVH
jgi:L-fuconolactonase